MVVTPAPNDIADTVALSVGDGKRRARNGRRDITIVVLANLYSDVHCEGQADTMVKLIIQELGLLSQ